MKNSFYLILLIILIGCNSKTQTKKAIDYDMPTFYVKKTVNTETWNDTTIWIEVDTTMKTIVEKDYNSIVNSKLNSWTKYYKKICTTFNINDFTQCDIWFLSPYLMNLEDYTSDVQNFIKLYKTYLIWNSDSTKAIDLYSNNIILDIDSLGNKTFDSDVDPHFAIIDFKNKKRIVLWQMGAISVFEGGFWLDANSVIITVRWAALDDNYDEGFSFNLSYYLVNLNTYQINEFCSKKTYRTKEF